jgi:hypothetical protein
MWPYLKQKLNGTIERKFKASSDESLGKSSSSGSYNGNVTHPVGGREPAWSTTTNGVGPNATTWPLASHLGSPCFEDLCIEIGTMG